MKPLALAKLLIWFAVIFVDTSIIDASSTKHSPPSFTRPLLEKCLNNVDQLCPKNDFSFTLQTRGDIDAPVVSDTFSWGGANWQLVYFPHGLKGTSKHVSAYLHLIDGKVESNSLSFKMTLQSRDRMSIERSSEPYNFNMESESRSWGFSKFCDCELIEGLKELKVEVSFSPAIVHQTGLVNAGNTCYMNSILQSLFHISAFREGIIASSTTATVSSELSSLFRSLKTSSSPASTVSLCDAMDILPPYQQEDAQEFKSNLLYGLDELDLISDLFQGSFMNSISCEGVNFRKSWEERFMEIAVDVTASTKSLDEAFEQYFGDEVMAGDNAYHVQGHGKQRAVKSVKLLDPPKVLHVQLKRFAYKDGRITKLSSPVNFSQELDLTPYLAVPGKKAIYKLHAVVVHTGDSSSSGHYYSYISSGKGWVKFDDTRVNEVSWQSVLEDGIGETVQPRPLFGLGRRRSSPTSAYLLQYIRTDLPTTEVADHMEL